MVTQNSMLCLACAKGHTNCQQIGQLNKLVPFLYTYSLFSQIRFFNSVILPLQFRNSHKGSNIHHHCRLHFALGVVRLPFASTIMATILSHYFLWQHHHQVLHVDKIYLLYCMHCILCKCRPNCKKALQINAKNVRNLLFWHHWRQNFSWYAGTVTPIYGIFSLMINCISDITTAVPATGMKNLSLSTVFCTDLVLLGKRLNFKPEYCEKWKTYFICVR